MGKYQSIKVLARFIPPKSQTQFRSSNSPSKYIYEKLNSFVKEETDNRVRVTKVKFMEHAKNAAYYVED